MDIASIANTIAMALYTAVFGHLLLTIKNQRNTNTQLIAWTISIALIAHGYGAYDAIVASRGFRIGFFVIPTLFFWAINFLVLVSGLRKPLHTLFLFLLPLSILAILSAMFANSAPVHIDRGLAGHIILSIVAYSLLSIATLQALLLGYLNRQLKHKHTTNLMRILPPLETMDALMFELIWAGQIVLTLSIATGIIFVANFKSLLISHHSVISVIAWLIYAILLWGHHQWGWRGKTAVRWAIGGFTALVLAYFGTKFVFDIIFDKQQLMENTQIIIED